jgi:vacuolar-type H+-ATPase subunit I/STV1
MSVYSAVHNMCTGPRGLFFQFCIFSCIFTFVYSTLFGNVYIRLLDILYNFLKYLHSTLHTCATGIMEVSLSIGCVVLLPTE